MGKNTLRVDLLVVPQRRRRDGSDALHLQMEVSFRALRPELQPRQFRQVRRRGAVLLRITTCVKIKILRRVRAESSCRPPRHRRDACSMASAAGAAGGGRGGACR